MLVGHLKVELQFRQSKYLKPVENFYRKLELINLSRRHLQLQISAGFARREEREEGVSPSDSARTLAATTLVSRLLRCAQGSDAALGGDVIDLSVSYAA